MSDPTLWDSMAELGWRYDIRDNVFCKEGMVVAFEEAEVALSAALKGIVWSTPANDAE